MEFLRSVPLKDLILMMEVSYELLDVKNINKMKQCLKKLHHLIQHDGSVTLLATKKSLKKKKPLYRCSSTGFGKEVLEKYINDMRDVKGSILITSLAQNVPFHWKTVWSKNNFRHDTKVKRMLSAYGFDDGLTCSTSFQNNQDISFLSIMGKKVETDPRTFSIMNYIAPHFAEALKSICYLKINWGQEIKEYKLTPCQLEVLNWIKEGKSAWEISVILNRSERVIAWHANNVLIKLGAKNRTHAVAIAMRNRLID